MKQSDYFVNRRSVRRFLEKEVEPSLLKSLIEGAMHAPTTGNMQLYSVVISAGAAKEKLHAAHFNQPAATGCPAILTFCIDFHRFEQWCEASGAVPGYDNLQAFLMGALDTAIFAQQFVTLAEMNGLGTCYLGTTTYNAGMIAESLELPGRVVPLLSVAVGYPAESPEDCGRLPVEAVMHSGTYHDRTAGEVKQLYSEKENREDSRQFVAENQKESLAQVFTDVRYTHESLEQFSNIFRQFVSQAGFNL